MDREGGSKGSCYYSVLGIHRDASCSDIRSAYHKLAMKWHPDRCSKNSLDVGVAKRRFQKIQEAYSVLSDQGKRSMYDAGFLDLFEKDEGMGDFMQDLMNIMEQNVAKEESLEDLQKTFVDLFGEDLVNMMQETGNPAVTKRTREHVNSERVTPKRSTNV